MKTPYVNSVALVLSMVLQSQEAISADRSTFILPSGVRIEIVEVTFAKDEFKIRGCTDHESKCLINGRLPFGVDLEVPKTYVKSITATFKGQTYMLDATDMYNAWGGRPLEMKGVRFFGGYCVNRKNCVFRGLFSDGGGSFVAEWKIVGGVSIRTIITDSPDVVNLFVDHIDSEKFD